MSKWTCFGFRLKRIGLEGPAEFFCSLGMKREIPGLRKLLDEKTKTVTGKKRA
jgi:hypothetical protein